MFEQPQPPTEERRPYRPEEIELEPWYKDGNDDVVEPDRVTLQSQYFWKQWVRLLGVGPAALLIRLRMYCYDNRETGERRDWCFPGQKTLARELGVHRETIMSWLQRLQAFDFIRRRPRTRWSAEHQRPVRTTDAYRIKMWDPVVPDHGGAAFVGDARRLVEGSEPPGENSVEFDKSEKPTIGQEAVDNPAQRSGISTHDAVGNLRNRKESPEGVLERYVSSASEPRPRPGSPVAVGEVLARKFRRREPPKEKHLVDVLPQITVSREKQDELLHVEDLAAKMFELLGDSRSKPFYRHVARRFLHAGLEQLVYRTLSEVRESSREGRLRNPAAVFTARVKELAAAHGIQL